MSGKHNNNHAKQDVAGFLGAPSHDPLSAALTSVAAALTWLASTPPAPALVRAHLDLAAMVLAGVVDPTTCVYASDDTVAWPASRGVARVGVAPRTRA